ncbi:MAG: FKBP-type peptidyl-prolyl cis-trans isomerase [Thermoflexibacter sp.]|jgi:peptidylprolyl isomerase|nr:FKBP-type peptidyl-prolyl cis-trans isomerase [Thermoflexibacter sp.]
MKSITYIFFFLISFVVLVGACRTKSAIDAEAFANREDIIIRQYLAEKKITAEKLPSGMYYQRLQQGIGEKPTARDTVSVHYTGNIIYSYVFDSSRLRDTPFSFTLGVGQVIRGWDLGVAEMRVGERGIFYIPSTLAYGSSGSPRDRNTNLQSVPPNSILIFDIEVLGIKKLRQ